MSKLRKRDDADRDSERERPGATLVMTFETSTTLSSTTTPISRDVEIEVCASTTYKIHNGIHKRTS